MKLSLVFRITQFKGNKYFFPIVFTLTKDTLRLMSVIWYGKKKLRKMRIQYWPRLSNIRENRWLYWIVDLNRRRNERFSVNVYRPVN